ncbi:MAG: PQQ-binding-like beta-propeller repeat protein [Nitriliruptoraceae bacterium]
MRETPRLVLTAVVALTGVALHAGLVVAAAPAVNADLGEAVDGLGREPTPDDGPVSDDPAPDDVDGAGTADPTWGDAVDGLLRFRGNLTHTFHGLGPLPAEPEIAWRFPDAPMCITEAMTREDIDEHGEPITIREDREWCGTGWTGQPIVRPRGDGVTEVIFGGFDGYVYFLDGDTGVSLRTPFRTDFQIKGTGALDPDGYPLFYIGSRDGHLRALALDREPVEEVWRLSRHPRGVWNDDWDGSPAVVDDVMYMGGEDSWFRAVQLNRGYDADGLVTLDPEVLIEVPGFDDELFRAVGDRDVSIENSVAIDVARDRVAFANSGGRLLVLSLSALRAGELDVLSDVWLGDDIDASIVIDPQDGDLYVAIELQRFLGRSVEVGQLVRLDLDRPDDPIVWSVDIPPRQPNDDGGAWATPALHDGYLYVATHPGELLVVDTTDGTVTFRDDIGWHAWSSPVVVEHDGTHQLLVATCMVPHLRAYDLTDPAVPSETWRLGLPGCIESTPAVWDERIWVGSRGGFFYAIR